MRHEVARLEQNERDIRNITVAFHEKIPSPHYFCVGRILSLMTFE